MHPKSNLDIASNLQAESDIMKHTDVPKISRPLVSVAIITYNQKNYLRECIESVLEQDYPNIEIVVADDGSDDGTRDLLLDYERKHPEKFVLRLSEKNRGITVNSNAAHFACSGTYVAWMGGDDLMLPNKLSKQVAYMEANPICTISYHNLEVFDSDTNENLYYFNKRNRSVNGDIRTSIRYGTFNGACSSMVRADRAPQDGFNAKFPVASDWYYWIEALANGGTINYIDEVLGRYRRHPNNVTSSRSGIGQNTLDHLNTCNLLIARFPQFFPDINYAYSMVLRGKRHELPYFNTLLYCFLCTGDIRSLIGLCVFILSLGRVRI